MFLHQKEGQNQNLLIGNKAFENVIEYQVFGNNSSRSEFHSCKN